MSLFNGCPLLMIFLVLAAGCLLLSLLHLQFVYLSSNCNVYQSYVSIAGSWSGVFAEDGRICQEGLGACGNLVGEDCNERCRVKHLGGKAEGICDMSVRTPLCVCYFNCTPPICVADLGFQQQYNFCKEKCESTYGGLLLNSSCGEEASDGSCHCQCQYICG